MSRFMNVFAVLALLMPLSSAAECDSQSGSCVDNDETSLVQVQKVVKFGSGRVDDKKAGHEKDEADKAESKDSQGQFPVPAPFVGYGMPAVAPMMPYAQPGMYAQGLSQPADYHYNQVTTQSQTSDGAAGEDPRTAAAKAAQHEEVAERAMEDAVWKAQQEERASMFASKRAAALRAASEKAAVAESSAARAQVAAADSMENAAVRKASTDRTHARVAAYKAIVQQATAYQASADQTFAAQRAAAARSAVEAANQGLHSMEQDTHAADNQFNDRDARRNDRHRYHNAMDEISYDRSRFRDQDEDEDYDLDEDEDYHGHGMRNGAQMPMAMAGGVGRHVRNCGHFNRRLCVAPAKFVPNPRAVACGLGGRCLAIHCCLVACAVGDPVMAVYAGDGKQYAATIAAMEGEQYAVGWKDGFEDGAMLAPSAIFKGGVPCGVAARAAAMGAVNPLAAAGFPMA